MPSSPSPHQSIQSTQSSSLPYPHSPDRTLHISITTLATSYLVFLTSASSSTSASAASSAGVAREGDAGVESGLAGTELVEGGMRGLSPLGSFVYGLPDRFSPTEPITTPLISVPDTVELATRICRILIIRLAKVAGPKAVYVGCSIMVDGFGDRVREEVDVLGCVVEEVGRLVAQGLRQVNGVGVESGG